MENLNIIAYTIYFSISAFVTIFVGKSLHKNGYHLILDLFEHQEFTRTTNNILLIGYYLVNLGYVAITIASFRLITTVTTLFEVLSYRIGTILFILGILHINNILTLTLLSKRKQKIIKFFNT